MAKHQIELFDGYDGGEYNYDEKKEKRFRSGTWVAAAVFVGLTLIWGISLHVQEILLKTEGECIEAIYNEDAQSARYTGENGRVIIISTDGYVPEHDGESIYLYYRYNPHAAKPVNRLGFWLGIYLFLGSILCLCIWRIVRIYKKG